MEDVINSVNYYDNIDYYDDVQVDRPVRLLKFYIRDLEDQFNIPEENFKKRFRFSHSSVLHIVDLVRSHLQKHNNKGLPIASEIAVLLTLRFYATASFQIVCGDLFKVSQATASNVVTKVSRLLAQLLRRYIKFPEGAQAAANRELFQRLGSHGRRPGLAGLDGAIDCTHVKIVSTPGCQHREVFRNRKTFFSLNVQMIVGPRTEILDVVARYASSTHDSRIFQMSSVFNAYERGKRSGRLVADNGYPALPFVLTPVKPTPTDPPSIRYNRAHVKTRNVVERTFGIWKQRFPCLSRGLGNKLQTVSYIIVACAVLHNLSLQMNDVISFDDEESKSEFDAPTTTAENTASGLLLRSSVIENYFQ